jgi:hypothetical protein
MAHQYKGVFMLIIYFVQHQGQMSDEDGALVESYSQGKTECLEKKLFQSHSFTTNPTTNDLSGVNPSNSRERDVTNQLYRTQYIREGCD